MLTATERPRLARLASLEDVAPAEWNALVGDDAFLCHEFLAALERTGCVGRGTAWDPCHLVARSSEGRLLGALPLYVKHDSRGEFVFDWSWADAYERAGLHYYPKLVSSVPFTPATGARLLIDPTAATTTVAEQLVDAARGLAEEFGASSLHVLFPTDREQSFLSERGFLTRKGCQFHWRNRGYRDFDDFLARFSSAKRKKVRRERRRIREAGIVFEHLRGDEPSASDWDAVFEFYSRTFHRRGRAPYLNRAFFDEIAMTMPDKLLIVLARCQGLPIATAICFRGGDTLYGRYWGSMADFHSLHFEACYYQGIEYCIREGLGCFEPGTQGEHKISRGFAPTATWSCHWLSEPGFHAAVEDFLVREQTHVDMYMEHLEGRVPYRRGEGGGDNPA
ncbi:GNAT family N-acetyltransferase [Candidatus Rariloculus sp.]|uniref:GNAT family N-acetyltransferase n=1 Tax=Candidatus Rariloculus sp. TaxID=3101265 RepID=UPI003D1091A2